MEKPGLDGSPCSLTVLSRTWFGEYREKGNTKPIKQLAVQQNGCRRPPIAAPDPQCYVTHRIRREIATCVLSR